MHHIKIQRTWRTWLWIYDMFMDQDICFKEAPSHDSVSKGMLRNVIFLMWVLCGEGKGGGWGAVFLGGQWKIELAQELLALPTGFRELAPCSWPKASKGELQRSMETFPLERKFWRSWKNGSLQLHGSGQSCETAEELSFPFIALSSSAESFSLMLPFLLPWLPSVVIVLQLYLLLQVSDLGPLFFP